jgi:hypothetical protein
MTEARKAIEGGNYAAYARQKLDRIDRHEHSAERLGVSPSGTLSGLCS